MANETELAATAEEKYLAALKKKQSEDEALMNAYKTESGDIYGQAKKGATDYLTGAKTDIENLYKQGYTDLENLTGQESAATMTDLVRQNENKLAKQGLLGGPSGALNEALAGASERVRTSQLSKLEDYINSKNSALGQLYGNQANTLSSLEQTYGTQNQGLLAAALQNQLGNTSAQAGATDKYTGTGLEAALSAEKQAQEQAGNIAITQEQGAQTRETKTLEDTLSQDNLTTAQKYWDDQYQSVFANLYRGYRQAGFPDVQASGNAKLETIKQIGNRPTTA